MQRQTGYIALQGLVSGCGYGYGARRYFGLGVGVSAFVQSLHSGFMLDGLSSGLVSGWVITGLGLHA